MVSVNLVSWFYIMVTFWFQVCEGACFAHGWRNFAPPRFAPTQFHHLYLHEEDNIHSCLFFTFLLIPEEDYIHSKFEPNPTVRGRGVSTKAPWFEKRSSTISACLLVWFWFSVRTCRCLIDVAFHFWIVSRRIDEDVWRILCPGIIDIHTCLGTRIGIWFIYGLFGYYIYFDVCDATLVNRLVFYVAGVAAFVLVK